MPSYLCLSFCLSLEFISLYYLHYLLSKLILQNFFWKSPFLEHLRQLNVPFSYSDNFCFMAGQHLVQFHLIIALHVFLGNSSFGHTHWGNNWRALPSLAKWQRCVPCWIEWALLSWTYFLNKQRKKHQHLLELILASEKCHDKTVHWFLLPDICHPQTALTPALP